jgi:hypothetical protein
LGAAFLTAAFFLAAAFFATLLTGVVFLALAALTAAQRFFCAAAIRFRAAALILRFLAGAAAFFVTLTGAVFTVALVAAQRFRCAAAIFLRAAALIVRFGLTDGEPADLPPRTTVSIPARRAWACWSCAISESIEERILSMLMAISVAEARTHLAVAFAQLLLWDHAGNNEVAGLKARREAESAS